MKRKRGKSRVLGGNALGLAVESHFQILLKETNHLVYFTAEEVAGSFLESLPAGRVADRDEVARWAVECVDAYNASEGR